MLTATLALALAAGHVHSGPLHPDNHSTAIVSTPCRALDAAALQQRAMRLEADVHGRRCVRWHTTRSPCAHHPHPHHHPRPLRLGRDCVSAWSALADRRRACRSPGVAFGTFPPMLQLRSSYGELRHPRGSRR
ncbi:hypothetical protein BDV95DRAFT_591989 [Massariosphaeria phaeospora]|uniref:Uncharacterized protein n=1 Tax=Massariosphaeria phaeospora TaxID=100035 RepID=A0A7C8MAC6_9PLEO|nr:hypothetical protein BDV95DRAFT_591989 [Massariosphaeria phaeospora]